MTIFLNCIRILVTSILALLPVQIAWNIICSKKKKLEGH